MKKLICLTTILATFFTAAAYAAKKQVLDARIEEALEEFYELTSAGRKLAQDAAAILVFPNVGKAGFWVGGEYGQGALLVDGKVQDYYSTSGASIGLTFGAQSRRQVVLFLEESALKKFRASEGWEVGVDGSVAIANIGAGGEVDSKTLKEPVVAFVFGNKGLMANLSIEGSKITKIYKD